MASAQISRPGLPGLLKEGTKHHMGIEGVILKNIEACEELGKLTRTSLGPNGMVGCPLFLPFPPPRSFFAAWLFLNQPCLGNKHVLFFVRCFSNWLAAAFFLC